MAHMLGTLMSLMYISDWINTGETPGPFFVSEREVKSPPCSESLLLLAWCCALWESPCWFLCHALLWLQCTIFGWCSYFLSLMYAVLQPGKERKWHFSTSMNKWWYLGNLWRRCNILFQIIIVLLKHPSLCQRDVFHERVDELNQGFLEYD